MKLSLPLVTLLTLTVFLINSPLVLAETQGTNTSILNTTDHGSEGTIGADLRTAHEPNSKIVTQNNHESSGSDHGKGTVVSCQNRQSEIKTRLSNMTNYISKNESKLDSTAQRVEGYYTSKFVPDGKTIPNYDSLISDISIKSAALKSALILVQTDANNFNCDNNPKDQVKKINTDVESAKKDLRIYQKSIQNLIGALRTLLPTTHLDGEKEGSRSGSTSGHLK